MHTTPMAGTLLVDDAPARQHRIVETLTEAFAPLMAANLAAFRTKFRKMAADPFAFYRGSACLFYTDVAALEDPWADERTKRVWIQGDLHAENFGTYMDGNGVLIFDVNDFDEAYLGHFTWDLQRLAASVALLGWQKALCDTDIDALVATYVRAYVARVRWFVDHADDEVFSLRLDTTDGPENKKFRGIAYEVKDVVGRSGFGIGSAGLPAYIVLIEGFNQALDNDVVLSMKQGNVAAPSRVVTDERIASYFQHHGHRTAISQRALQAYADPLLGYTELDGVGYVVSELSPYVTDLDWSELTEPDEIAPVLDHLGRATAKMHCVSDADSDHTLVSFQTENAIAAVIGDREAQFVDWLTTFARDYAAVVRDDHRLFVDAFRNDEISGVHATRQR